MADISTITLPNGDIYNLKDSTARSTIPSASSTTPKNLGIAAAGSSSSVSRSDHVHAMPSANDVGAIAVPASASIGDVITYTTTGWTAAPNTGTIVNLLEVYPIGSIYMSTVDISPASLFGGYWARITGKFLLGATDNGSSGAEQAAGNTGGVAEVALDDEKYLPAHTHGSKTLTGYIHIRKVGNTPSAAVGGGSGIASIADDTGTKYEPLQQYDGTKRVSQKITITATHTHSSVGSGTAHENMPPYLAVYMWQRVEPPQS